MTDQELIKALREDAEWAHANEWETPITLGDNLEAAADRMEALLAENERLNIELQAMRNAANGYKKMIPRWVSVDEQLPEDRGDVLAVAFWHETWSVHLGWYNDRCDCWHIVTSTGDHRDITVTHWMPLPKPPRTEVEQ